MLKLKKMNTVNKCKWERSGPPFITEKCRRNGAKLGWTNWPTDNTRV